MAKLIAVDLPYPIIDDILEDFRSASIICTAYAGAHGELNATLQYVYHNIKAACQDQSIADVLMGIAKCEMAHMHLLGELLFKLGVDPVYMECPPCRGGFYSASSVRYGTNLNKILLDDIAGEMIAISDYEKMLKMLKNEKVEAVIRRILIDEQLHVRVLKDCLNSLMFT